MQLLMMLKSMNKEVKPEQEINGSDSDLKINLHPSGKDSESNSDSNEGT